MVCSSVRVRVASGRLRLPSLVRWTFGSTSTRQLCVFANVASKLRTQSCLAVTALRLIETHDMQCHGSAVTLDLASQTQVRGIWSAGRGGNPSLRRMATLTSESAIRRRADDGKARRNALAPLLEQDRRRAVSLSVQFLLSVNSRRTTLSSWWVISRWSLN